MNEYGFAVVIFTAAGTKIGELNGRTPLFFSSLFRTLLDKCRTVDDALELLQKYVLAPLDIPMHFMIADASGKSAIIEYIDGEMKVLTDDKPYQICANFLIYNNPERKGFGKDRFEGYEEYLEANGGIIDEKSAMQLLHKHHITDDERYSVVFNLTKRTATVHFTPTLIPITNMIYL